MCRHRRSPSERTRGNCQPTERPTGEPRARNDVASCRSLGRAEHSRGGPGPKLMLGNASAIPSAATSIPAPVTPRSARDMTEGVGVSRRNRAGVWRERARASRGVGLCTSHCKAGSNLGHVLVIVRAPAMRLSGVVPNYPPNPCHSGFWERNGALLTLASSREQGEQVSRDERVESRYRGRGGGAAP